MCQSPIAKREEQHISIPDQRWTVHLTVPGRLQAAHCSWGGGETLHDGKREKINPPRPQACVCVCVCVSCVASINLRVCSSVSCVPLKKPDKGLKKDRSRVSMLSSLHVFSVGQCVCVCVCVCVCKKFVCVFDRISHPEGNFKCIELCQE